jgi:histidine triad (HIT) family protein
MKRGDAINELIVGVAFGKFSKLLPIKRLRETDKIVAFYHPKPSYKFHILIVPKKKIKSIGTINPDDLAYISEVFKVANEIIQELSLESINYSIITNGGSNQNIKQLHFHLVGDL